MPSNFQRARLEAADAGGDENGLGDEAGAERGLQVETTVIALLTR
jgi:hypothetical protein